MEGRRHRAQHRVTLAFACRTWLERAASVFEQGGFRAGDVEALAQQSQQFMWAGADLQAGIPELVSRLREAQAWAHRVRHTLLLLLCCVVSLSLAQTWPITPRQTSGVRGMPE